MLWRGPFPNQSSGSVRVAVLPGWAVALAALAVVAVGLFVLLIGAAVALFLAPVGLAAFLYGRWRLRRMLGELARRSRREPRASTPPVIETDYRVIRED